MSKKQLNRENKKLFLMKGQLVLQKFLVKSLNQDLKQAMQKSNQISLMK